MDTVNIHEAKTHLSRLLERVKAGEEIIIAKAGKPIARLTPMEPTPPRRVKRFGFMKGEVSVPERSEFKEIGREEIEQMFYGEE